MEPGEIIERGKQEARTIVLDPIVVAYMGDMILALKKSGWGFLCKPQTYQSDTASSPNQS